VGFRSYPRIYFELLLAGFILVMGMSLSSAFLPLFGNELDPSGVLVGFVVSAWFFSRIFTELPSGVLSDRFGRRKLLVSGLALAVGGALTCSLAESAHLLIVGRAIWGLGTALYFMSNTALILDLFDPDIRGRALGTFQGIEFIGSFIGAPIGGFVAGMIGYRRVFSLAFILILCSFAIAFTSGGLRRMGGGTRKGVESSVKGIFSSLTNWSLAVICLNSFSRMFIMQGVISTVFPLYLNHQLGISVELIGILMAFRTAGHIVSTVTCGYLSDRFGRKPMIITGLLVQSSCMYLFTIPWPFEILTLIGFIDGFGIGMAFTSLIVLLSEIASTEVRGASIGLYRTFMDIGGFIGPPVFMLLFNTIGSQLTFFSAAATLMLNILLMITIRVRKQ